jgi:hypothetical protein
MSRPRYVRLISLRQTRNEGAKVGESIGVAHVIVWETDGSWHALCRTKIRPGYITSNVRMNRGPVITKYRFRMTMLPEVSICGVCQYRTFRGPVTK